MVWGVLMVWLGTQLISLSRTVPELLEYLAEVFVEIFRPPYRFREFINQLYFVANQSLLIVLVCVTFAAMVTILESSFHMKLVIQNDSMVPGFAAMLILRELGVVVTALLLTSRVGAGIAAEVGSMKVTEQIDALRMIGIRPIHYLVVPRLFACVFGSVLLVIFANAICLYVAMLVSEFYLGFTQATFLIALNRFVEMKDFWFSLIKAAVFGAVIPIVSCYFGFRTLAGAEGVGSSTTKSVVSSSICIIMFDFILSYIFSHFY